MDNRKNLGGKRFREPYKGGGDNLSKGGRDRGLQWEIWNKEGVQAEEFWGLRRSAATEPIREYFGEGRWRFSQDAQVSGAYRQRLAKTLEGRTGWATFRFEGFF